MHISLVDDTLIEPNGVAFSPVKRVLYLTDTSAGEAIVSLSILLAPHTTLLSSELYMHMTLVRTDFTWTMCPTVSRSAVRNIVTATSQGVDILTSDGRPLVRALTNFAVTNLEFAKDEV